MPGIINPFLGVVTSSAIDLTEPWGEVASQASISGGALTVSGLDMSGLIAVRLYIDDISVTTDDSTVSVRLIIAGSEISSGYDWTHNNVSAALGSVLVANASDSGAGLVHTTATRGVGNASTEGLHAIVTLWNPAGSQPKGFSYTGAYLNPSTVIHEVAMGIGYLSAQTGVVTGFKVYGSSNLTSGSLTALGME